MSGAIPTLRAPAQISISSWSPTFISRSHSLKTQRRLRGGGGQRWKLHMVWGTMERDKYLDLWGFLNAQRGQYGQFTVTLPTGIWPYGSWAGSPLVNGAASAGASSVAMDGFTPSASNVARRGDFVLFAGHTKVYQVTADANANGSGQATISILPNLVAAVADNEGVTTSGVAFTCILAGDEQGLDLQPPTQGTLSVDAIEDY